MKKILKYNVPAAVAGLAVVIILSMLLGTLRSVNSMSRKVTAKYEVKHITYGSPASDAGKLAGYADQIIGIAAGQGVDCTALREARAEFSAASGDPFAVSQAYSALRTEEAVVYGKLAGADGGATDRSLANYHTEFISTCQRMAKNTYYNDQARKYNSAIKTFPASLFFGNRAPAAVFE